MKSQLAVMLLCLVFTSATWAKDGEQCFAKYDLKIDVEQTKDKDLSVSFEDIAKGEKKDVSTIQSLDGSDNLIYIALLSHKLKQVELVKYRHKVIVNLQKFISYWSKSELASDPLVKRALADARAHIAALRDGKQVTPALMRDIMSNVLKPVDVAVLEAKQRNIDVEAKPIVKPEALAGFYKEKKAEILDKIVQEKCLEFNVKPLTEKDIEMLENYREQKRGQESSESSQSVE